MELNSRIAEMELEKAGKTNPGPMDRPLPVCGDGMQKYCRALRGNVCR